MKWINAAFVLTAFICGMWAGVHLVNRGFLFNPVTFTCIDEKQLEDAKRNGSEKCTYDWWPIKEGCDREKDRIACDTSRLGMIMMPEDIMMCVQPTDGPMHWTKLDHKVACVLWEKWK